MGEGPLAAVAAEGPLGAPPGGLLGALLGGGPGHPSANAAAKGMQGEMEEETGREREKETEKETGKETETERGRGRETGHGVTETAADSSNSSFMPIINSSPGLSSQVGGPQWLRGLTSDLIEQTAETETTGTTTTAAGRGPQLQRISADRKASTAP